ncbi:MAG TPA: S9 family peptidase, partial [Acidobacteriaceae bacterium]
MDFARRHPLPLFAFTCSLLLSGALSAQTASHPPTKPTLAPAADTANPNQQFSRAAQPGGVALSPDGTTVAWTLRGHDGSTLHLTEVDDPAKSKIIAVEGTTDCSNTSPIWSPDSKTLAFLSTCTGDKAKPTQEQIFLWSKTTGRTKQLSHLTGNLQQPSWSPNGKSIAFLFVENATRSAGALDAMKPWSGVIGEDGVEIQQVWAVEVSSGGARIVTPFDLHAYEFTWSPDSAQIAFVGAIPPGENN